MNKNLNKIIIKSLNRKITNLSSYFSFIKLFFLAAFVTSFFLLTSCDNNEVKKNENLEIELKAEKEEIPEDRRYTPMPDGRQMLDIIEIRSKKPTLDPEQLANFIPKKINNYPHGSLNFYQADDGYASVSTIYRTSASSGVELRIFDNGPTAPLLDERFFKVLPQEVNMTTSEIKRENGRGFLIMSPDFSTANLSVLFNNRINIIFKTYGMTEESNKPEEFLDLIDINKLLELLN